MTIEITEKEWRAAGERRYGPNTKNWRFKCPVCGWTATPVDWKQAGASDGEIAFSCVGRHLNGHNAFAKEQKSPCNYAGGGLFRLNPIVVKSEDGQENNIFDFADEPLVR